MGNDFARQINIINRVAIDVFFAAQVARQRCLRLSAVNENSQSVSVVNKTAIIDRGELFYLYSRNE